MLSRRVKVATVSSRRCFSTEAVLSVTHEWKRLAPVQYISHISEITHQSDASKALPKLQPWPELLKRVQKRAPGFTGQEVYQMLTILLAGPNRIAIDFAAKSAPQVRDVFLIDLVENLEEGVCELSNIQLAHSIYLIATKSPRVLFPILRSKTASSSNQQSNESLNSELFSSLLIDDVQTRDWVGEDKAVVTLLRGLVRAEKQKMFGHHANIHAGVSSTISYILENVDFVQMNTTNLLASGLALARLTPACPERFDTNFWTSFWKATIKRDSTVDFSARHWGDAYCAYSLLSIDRPNLGETEKQIDEWLLLVRYKALRSVEKFGVEDSVIFLQAMLSCKHIDNAHDLVIKLAQNISLTPTSSLSGKLRDKVYDIGFRIKQWERLSVSMQFALSPEEWAIFDPSVNEK